MAEILTSGKYSISSFAAQSHVGRRESGVGPPVPAKIVSLPKDIQDYWWSIERASDGKYHLKSLGAWTIVIDHLVFALLLDRPPPEEEWVITAQPQHGKNVYTIEKPNSGEGWVLPNPKDPDVQVACRSLIVAPSIPPRYPQNELWLILPIAE